MPIHQLCEMISTVFVSVSVIAEVDIKGEKGQEIEDHHGLELVEDNKEKYENKEKESEHVLQAGNIKNNKLIELKTYNFD